MPPSSESAESAVTAVSLAADLHARPAGRLIKVAAGFQSRTHLEHAGKTIGLTGILAVLGLGATAGATVVIRADGPDAERAVRALAQVLDDAE